jgi:hypothetical protein
VGSEGKRDVKGEGLNGPLRRKTGCGKRCQRPKAKGVTWIRGILGMMDTRKEVGGDRRGECKLEGMKGLRMMDSMGIGRKVIVGPRRFGGKRDVRGGKKNQFMKK